MLKKIALTVAVTACVTLSPSVFSAEKSALTLIPEHYKGLLRINVKKAFANKMIAEKATELIKTKIPAADLTALGIDPVKDFSNIVVGFTVPETKGEQGQGTAVIETTREIDLNKIFDFAERKKHKVIRIKIAKFDAFSIKTSSLGPNQQYVVKVAPKRIVISSKESLKKTIKLLTGGGKNITTNSDVMSLCNNGLKNEMVWLIGEFPQEPVQPGQPPMPEKGVFSLDLNKKILDVGLELLFPTAEAATQTGSQLSMLTMMAPSLTQNAIAATDIKLATKEKKVILKLSLTEEKLKKIAALVDQKVKQKPVASTSKQK